MPKIDLSRQTNLQIDSDATLLVSGILSVTDGGTLWVDGETLDSQKITMLSGLTSNVQDQLDDINTDLSTTEQVANWFTNLKSVQATRQDKNTAIAHDHNIGAGFHVAGAADNFNIWLVFINGQAVPTSAIQAITNVGNDITIDFDRAELGFRLKNNHEITVWGPMVNA